MESGIYEEISKKGEIYTLSEASNFERHRKGVSTTLIKKA